VVRRIRKFLLFGEGKTNERGLRPLSVRLFPWGKRGYLAGKIKNQISKIKDIE